MLLIADDTIAVLGTEAQREQFRTFVTPAISPVPSATAQLEMMSGQSNG